MLDFEGLSIMNKEQIPPRPDKNSLAGPPSNFLNDPLNYMLKCRQEFGELVQLDMGFGSLYLVFGADEVAQASKDKALGRSATAKLFEPLFGGSLIENDGAQWKQQRAYLSKSISSDRRKQMNDNYVQFASNAIATAKGSFDETGYADIQLAVYRYVSDSLATAFFGHQLSYEDTSLIVESWSRSLDCMSERLSSMLPLPMYVPTPNNTKLNNHAKKIDTILNDLIESSLSSNNSQGCLKHVLDHVSDSEPDKMSKKQIFKELRAAYLAAFDNTATSITWLMYNLANDPALQNKIRDEIIKSEKNDSDPLSGSMPLLESAFNESIRLSPPLWIVDRTATEDTMLGKYKIPKGATLIISPFITQRDPQYWRDPLKFIPDRFVNENISSAHRYTFFPFGIGKFKCPGVSLSLMLAKIFAVKIIKSNDIGIYAWNDNKFDRGLVYRTGELNITFNEIINNNVLKKSDVREEIYT